MDKEALEQKLFNHLAQSSLVLTPVNVGFTLEIGVEDAVKLLEELKAENKVELVSGSGTGATYKQTGQSAYQTTPGTTSVLPPKSSASLYQMIANFIIPGLGSLLFGQWVSAIFVFLLFAGGISMIVFLDDWYKLFSILMLLASWIVSIYIGIHDYQKDPWAKKEQPTEETKFG